MEAKIGNGTFIHPTAIVDDDVVIGENCKIWCFTHIQKGAEIGDNVTIGQNVNIGNNVHIGNGCKIQTNCFLPEGVYLQDDVFFGPNVTCTNVHFPRANKPVRNIDYLETVFKHGCTVGAGSTILPGVFIGKNSFVGAGSVVTKHVSDDTMVYGCPAKEIRKKIKANE